jgi:hypothetical protein
MGCVGKGTFSRRAITVVAAVTFLLVVIGHLPTSLQAQASAGSAAVPDLSAIWQRSGRAVTPSELPLNARGIGMREAIDEALHPMYDCVPAPIPHIMGDPYNFSIEQLPDRVIIKFEKDDVTRTVWLEGHGHREAIASDYSVQGYSTGRYENGQLVVETSKFTFDPGGLEDKPPMVPSSTSKTTVERYSRDGDRLTVELALEDPLILTEPVEYRYQFEATETALVEWIPCDPAQSRAPLRYIPEDQLKYGIR